MSLCPELEERQVLSEAEFWERVAGSLSEVDDYEGYYDKLDNDSEELGDPCSVCSSRTPCCYDSEDRPMIHVEPSEDELSN